MKTGWRHGVHGWLAALAFLGGAATAGSAAPTVEVPIVLRDLPLLLVDDAGIAAQRGVVRTLHPARTRAAPVLVADRPWEGGRVYTYGSVEFDEATRQFRLWYMARTQRADGTKPAPQLRNGGQDVVLLATSSDGLAWDKPALGLHAFDGSTANNIVFDAHSPAVIVDRFEREPARRYKMLAYHRGGYLAAFSADGVRWAESAKNPVFPGGDTMSLTQDPRTGEFLAYFKKPDPSGPGRVVWLTRSRDFQTWSEAKLVLRTDAEDNRWATRPEQRTDVYGMTVLLHAAGFVGLPRIFQVIDESPKGTKKAVGQSGQDGAIDVQLATSGDGENWHRSTPRLAMIPRGAPGTFDGGVILGTTNGGVEVRDEFWLYYTAINTGHGAPIPPKQSAIGRAVWRRHGFASLDAGPAGGRVETKALRLAEPRLEINADASRGDVRVALLEADGRPIARRALADCEPLRGDDVRWRVRWRDGATVPTDRAVRLRIEMTSARLYSVSAVAATK